jgi:hypothetical protein
VIDLHAPDQESLLHKRFQSRTAERVAQCAPVGSINHGCFEPDERPGQASDAGHQRVKHFRDLAMWIDEQVPPGGPRTARKSAYGHESLDPAADERQGRQQLSALLDNDCAKGSTGRKLFGTLPNGFGP